jgi:hypothetical protein
MGFGVDRTEETQEQGTEALDRMGYGSSHLLSDLKWLLARPVPMKGCSPGLWPEDGQPGWHNQTHA